MEIKSLQKLLWIPSAYSHLVVTLSKYPYSPLFPLVNVEYHENWLLAVVTLNNIEKGGGGEGESHQSGDQHQADVTLSLESLLST